MKKILILYTSVGLGHKVIAENIGFQLEQAGHTVRLFDIKQVETGKFGSAIMIGHRLINNYVPFVWGWLYRWGYHLMMPFRVILAGNDHKSTYRLIKDFQPDLVISSQITASAVVAYLKSKNLYKNLFAITFSDYHLHPAWVFNQADFYLVNIPEQEQEMRRRGIKQPIFVCGMTLKPKAVVDQASVKAKFDIKQGEKVVLIASGSLGTQISPEKIEALISELHQRAQKQELTIRPIMVCGKNQELYEILKKNIDPSQATILSYYTPMSELYAIADLFLTKPGGLSTAEAILWQLPMLITHWLPGQEEINYQYLQKNHLVMLGPENPYSMTASFIAEQSIEELKTGKFEQSLLQNQTAKVIPQDQPDGPVSQAIEEMLDLGNPGVDA